MASLENAISKFWQVDQVNNPLSFTAEEIECEEHFKRTYNRDHQGRFIVELPLKQGVLQSLGNSYEIAWKRFGSLERKLNKNSELKEHYTQFINECQVLGHMQLVNSDVRMYKKQNLCIIYHITPF